MKKSIKKITLALALLICVNGVISTPVLAKNNNKKVVYYEEPVITEPFVDSELVGMSKDDGITLFNNYGESWESTMLPTVYKTVYVTPTGQPGDGYLGGPTKDWNAFFFETGGSSTKFTVTINASPVTFTAETGRMTSAGSGYSVGVPKTTGRYRLQLIKYYTIKTKRTDVYKYGVYQYSFNTYTPSYALDYRWVKL